MTNDRVDVSRGVDERGAENNHAEAQVAAGDGLTQDNPSRPAEHQEKVRLGQEAMARQRRGWEDWLTIGEAFEVGRAEVMREIKTNETVGRRYEKAMQGWLIANGFTEIDKGTRSRLLECLKHRTEIERWRSVLTSSEQFRYNHPNTVLRKWKAATAVPDPNATPRISPFTKLKESIALLDEENHRLRREIERGGAGVARILERDRQHGRHAGRAHAAGGEGPRIISHHDVAAAGYAVGKGSKIQHRSNPPGREVRGADRLGTAR